MRTQVIGIEASEGVSGKTGKAYSIAQLHCIAPLAAPMAGGVARGSMGTTYRVDAAIVKGLGERPVPFLADLNIRTVMKFGKPEMEVLEVVPAAAPLAAGK